MNRERFKKKIGDSSKFDDDRLKSAQQMECQWEDCKKHCSNLDGLVQPVIEDHVEPLTSRCFVCLWHRRSRDGKPFKAKYMLVVHMRRHTGEKPHRCRSEGCDKAYSRPENLKTSCMQFNKDVLVSVYVKRS